MARSSGITVLEPAANLKGHQWLLSKRNFTVEALTGLPKRCYMFLDVKDYPPADGRREALLAHFDVPVFVAHRTCFELNGYFGSKARYDDPVRAESITSYATWFRCIVKMVRKVYQDPHEDGLEYVMGEEDYKWYEMSFFSRWTPDSSQVLCVDVPQDYPTELKRLLEQQSWPLEFQDPFAMHASLVDQMNVYYDVAVWRVRDPVRLLEKARMRLGAIFGPIHEMSRHAIHTTEVLDAAIGTIEELRRCRTALYERLSSNLGEEYIEQVKGYADFQISVLKNLQLRAISNRERLTNEVNLAFNLLARQDNSVMKTIGVLSIIFFPATFISVIFSTSFFAYTDEGEWVVSDKLWLYWATIIPATIVCMLLWSAWFSESDAIVGLLYAFRDFVKGGWRKRNRAMPTKADQA